MISVEITSSDSDINSGVYNYGFDFITMGYALKHDIIVRSKNWQGKELSLIIVKDGLKIKVNDNVGYYLSNEKKVSGTKVLQKDDVIKIENTSLKILDFKETQISPPDTRELYQKRISESPEVTPLLDKIASELREQE